MRTVIAESDYDRWKTDCPEGLPLCHSCVYEIVEEEGELCERCKEIEKEMEDEEDEDN